MSEQGRLNLRQYFDEHREEVALLSRGADPSYGPETDYVGWLCGMEFSREHGLPNDWEIVPDGDRGVDFLAPMVCQLCFEAGLPAIPRLEGFKVICGEHEAVALMRRIQVKGFRKPWHLLVKEGKTEAAIYVLAHFFDAAAGKPARAEFIGWTTRYFVERAALSTWPEQTRNRVLPGPGTNSKLFGKAPADAWRTMADFRARLLPRFE